MTSYRDSISASFLRSALSLEGRFQTVAETQAQMEADSTRYPFSVQKIPFREMDQWLFAEDPYRLVHRTGRFFSIEGLRVRTNQGLVKQWNQPIIHQPEVGILGIITRDFDGLRYFLMQAKMEPGNVNRLQLSPTVQATHSNYTRVHAGRQPPYLEYFLSRARSRVLVDQLQSEQGARFLRKRNRNMVVEVEGDLPLHEGFCWLTLGQIKRLLRIPNLVNMDARTVLSCIPCIHPAWRVQLPAEIRVEPDHAVVMEHRLEGFAKNLLLSGLDAPRPCHSREEILSWITAAKARTELTVERIPLDRVEGWIQDERQIRHQSGQHFAVIAVAVEAGTREVSRWSQPLLEHFGYGLVGFLVRKLGETLHFLVRASLEPGNRDLIELGPTVACANPDERAGQPSAPAFLEHFLNPAADRIRYQAVQSEEGGRFYHFQNRYMVLEWPAEEELDVPEDFAWMTLGQIYELTRHGYFNIEARNLLSCLDFTSSP